MAECLHLALANNIFCNHNPDNKHLRIHVRREVTAGSENTTEDILDTLKIINIKSKS